MNKTEVKTRIVDHLRTGGNVYKPNGFMHAIMHQVGLADRGSSRGPNRQLVMQAMTELEAEHRVTITRRNKQVVGICLDSDDSERFVPATAEGRRQSRWATDASGRHLPGTLPDHLVGPLQVRMIDPQILHKSKQNGTKPMPENPTIEYHYGDQFLGTLNAALAELRRHVDATGLGDGLSIKKVLEATGLTSSQVARVLDFLRALDLYSTFKSGWARSSYQVKLEPIELTPDMMERARKVVDSI